MSGTGALAGGRDAFEREAWSDARTLLAQADRETPLEPEDLERLAAATFLIGDEAACIDALTRAHHGFLERAEPIAAARNAIRLAHAMLQQPASQAQATGWLARARRLIDECATDCAERGFLLCAEAFLSVRANDVVTAGALFGQAAEIASRFKDRDVLALARHGQGRVLLGQDKIPEGFAMLDEVMVSVTCGEVDPIISGIVYCSVLSAVSRSLRSAPRKRVDHRADRVVRCTSRHALQGRMPRAPVGDAAVAGRLGGSARRSGTGVRANR
jgi:hypothetical protein